MKGDLSAQTYTKLGLGERSSTTRPDVNQFPLGWGRRGCSELRPVLSVHTRLHGLDAERDGGCGTACCRPQDVAACPVRLHGRHSAAAHVELLKIPRDQDLAGIQWLVSEPKETHQQSKPLARYGAPGCDVLTIQFCNDSVLQCQFCAKGVLWMGHLLGVWFSPFFPSVVGYAADRSLGNQEPRGWALSGLPPVTTSSLIGQDVQEVCELKLQELVRGFSSLVHAGIWTVSDHC